MEEIFLHLFSRVKFEGNADKGGGIMGRKNCETWTNRFYISSYKKNREGRHVGLINVSFFHRLGIRDCLRKKEWSYKTRGGDINSRKGEKRRGGGVRIDFLF